MKVKTVLLGIAAVFVLSFGANMKNNANAEVQGAGAESKGLSVSPSVDHLGNLQLGEAYTREMILVNGSEKDITFKVLTSSFWVEDESYDLKWGASQSQYAKIAGWTDIDQTKEHKVKAGETYKFKYRITVPENQAGGAQRLMIAIVLSSNGAEGFVATETHLNTLGFANVEGDVNPDAEIISQHIQKFSLSPSIRTTSVVKNIGNVDLDVDYSLRVEAFFGRAEVYSFQEEKVLMTESARMLEQVWSEAPLLGLFHVTQEITLLGETHMFSGIALVCPLWLIILVAMGIAVLIICIVRQAKTRARNKH